MKGLYAFFPCPCQFPHMRCSACCSHIICKARRGSKYGYQQWFGTEVFIADDKMSFSGHSGWVHVWVSAPEERTQHWVWRGWVRCEKAGWRCWWPKGCSEDWFPRLDGRVQRDIEQPQWTSGELGSDLHCSPGIFADLEPYSTWQSDSSTAVML